MSESNTDIARTPLSRRDFIYGRWLRRLTKETEEPRHISVDVRDFVDIDLAGGDRVSLEIDKPGFQEYVNRKLIQPVALDFPNTWSYVFDVRPRPARGSAAEKFLNKVMGVSFLSNYATTLINVPRIWEALPLWDKTEGKLREEICRTVVHETQHIAQYSNLETREKAIRDGRFRKDWYLGGEILSHLEGLGGGVIIQDLLDKEKLKLPGKISRRKFLKISAASLSGLGLGNLVSEEVGWSASVFFDYKVDNSHKLCYEEENNWLGIRDLIEVGKVSKR